MSARLRVLVVDDARLARREMQTLLAAMDGVECIGEADDVPAAREALARLHPDVVLLDIQMPSGSGFDVLDGLQVPPSVIFTTAYDQYAVQAFETQAVDYVLKPVQPARLEKTVQKMRAALDQRAPAAIETGVNPIGATAGLQAAADQLRQLLAAIDAPAAAPPTAPLRQLAVSTAGSGGATIRMVPLGDVLYLQAADKYVRVVTTDGEHLLRTPLKDLQPQLDAAQFWQIHRSTLVRADAIDTVQRDDAGKLHLTLRGCPERLAVSRLYAHLFKAL